MWYERYAVAGRSEDKILEDTVPRTKSSAALPNQITTPPASTIEPSNSAGELQYLG